MTNHEDSMLKDISNSLFWLFGLQGVTFIAMGVLIYHYPAIIVGLVIGGFIWMGLSALITGIKIKKFSKSMAALATA
jgi:hypothetical protein